jgi:hypothetical protein
VATQPGVTHWSLRLQAILCRASAGSTSVPRALLIRPRSGRCDDVGAGEVAVDLEDTEGAMRLAPFAGSSDPRMVRLLR